MTKRNAQKQAAVEKYEEFHRYPPTKIGDFHPKFKIPGYVYAGGKGKWITYRSPKVDPSTLQKPRRAVDYVHDFNAGVMIYLASSKDRGSVGRRVRVPEEFTSADALCCLGKCLGFCFDGEDDQGEVEAESTEPLPELYCVPDGKCLVVVQSKKDLIAMIWGGALGVFARGIDG